MTTSFRHKALFASFFRDWKKEVRTCRKTRAVPVISDWRAFLYRPKLDASKANIVSGR